MSVPVDANDPVSAYVPVRVSPDPSSISVHVAHESVYVAPERILTVPDPPTRVTIGGFVSRGRESTTLIVRVIQVAVLPAISETL